VTDATAKVPIVETVSIERFLQSEARGSLKPRVQQPDQAIESTGFSRCKPSERKTASTAQVISPGRITSAAAAAGESAPVSVARDTYAMTRKLVDLELALKNEMLLKEALAAEVDSLKAQLHTNLTNNTSTYIRVQQTNNLSAVLEENRRLKAEVEEFENDFLKRDQEAIEEEGRVKEIISELETLKLENAAIIERTEKRDRQEIDKLKREIKAKEEHINNLTAQLDHLM
jgi:chromosome segregation ATPase